MPGKARHGQARRPSQGRKEIIHSPALVAPSSSTWRKPSRSTRWTSTSSRLRATRRPRRASRGVPRRARRPRVAPHRLAAALPDGAPPPPHLWPAIDSAPRHRHRSQANPNGCGSGALAEPARARLLRRRRMAVTGRYPAPASAGGGGPAPRPTTALIAQATRWPITGGQPSARADAGHRDHAAEQPAADHQRVAPQIEVSQQQHLEQCRHLQPRAPIAASRNSGVRVGREPDGVDDARRRGDHQRGRAVCTAAAPRRMRLASSEISSACFLSSRSARPPRARRRSCGTAVEGGLDLDVDPGERRNDR